MMTVWHSSRASDNEVLHPLTLRQGLIIETLSNTALLCLAMICSPNSSTLETHLPILSCNKAMKLKGNNSKVQRLL